MDLYMGLGHSGFKIKMIKLIALLLYIARKTILKLWIYKDTSSTDHWYEGILEVLRLEKLTHTLHDNVKGLRHGSLYIVSLKSFLVDL